MLPPPNIIAPGQLSISEVFIEYDGPQLYACVGEAKDFFIVVHTLPAHDGDRWIFAPISQKRLKRVSKGSLEIRKAFSDPELGFVDILYFSSGQFIRHDRVPAKDLHPDLLPDPGERIGEVPVPATLRMDLAYASEPLPSYRVPAPDFAERVSPMWEFSEEALAFFRAARTPTPVIAARTGRTVADVTFKKGERRIDIPLSVLGSVATITQRLIDSLALDPSNTSLRASEGEWTQLDAVASFPSSFGLRLESHLGTLAGGGHAAEAFSRLVSLLEAGDDFGRLAAQLKSVAKRAVPNYKAFIGAISRGESDVTVEYASPDRRVSSVATLTRGQTERVRKYLELEAEPVSEEMFFRGRLVAINLPSRFFRMESDKEAISGRVSDEAADSMPGRVIDREYEASVVLTTDIDEVTGDEKHRYELKSLSD
jgi:hypothetical protein